MFGQGIISKICKKSGLSITAKMSVGVNLGVNSCLFLYVCPVMNWRLIQCVPRRRPMSAGISSKPLHDPDKDKCFQIMDEWISDKQAILLYIKLHRVFAYILIRT